MKKKIYNLSIITILILLVILICYLLFKISNIENKVENLEDLTQKYSNRIEELGMEIYNLQQNNTISDDEQNSSTIEEIEDTIIFENLSTEGLTPITKEEALNISNNYIVNYKIVNSYEILKIEKGEKNPNNYISTNYMDGKEEEKVANFSRECYIIYYEIKETSDNLEVYVDIYTGKVIGGYYHGI